MWLTHEAHTLFLFSPTGLCPPIFEGQGPLGALHVVGLRKFLTGLMSYLQEEGKLKRCSFLILDCSTIGV